MHSASLEKGRFMRPRILAKIVIFLISLVLLWRGITTLMIGFSSKTPPAVRVINQIGSWSAIVLCIFGFLLVAALVRRDGSLF